jgi:exonuclease III
LQNVSVPPHVVHALPIEPNSSKCNISSNNKVKRKNIDIQNDFEAIKENLHLRAQRKTTRVATWNINNGFDHLAIASIMVKKDIDILALQEPRLSNSTKDDVWIATMRKELRKSKLELITTQFSYLVFDEQTSGAALASIIRQVSNVQGRLLSVTFKTDDLWEVHTVISIYAVTNPKSTRKYANSRNSRKDVSTKLTKALYDEIIYLRETFGEAPIIIVGDFQDSIHDDHRDNIVMTGKKMNPDGPLYSLVNEGFVSAYHKLFPNLQQVTRWNSSKSAGRHIDLQMMNSTAASLLQHIEIDDSFSRNHITSDHLIVIADYNIEKREQDIVDCYRKRINFRKIAGIKMKCTKHRSRLKNTTGKMAESGKYKSNEQAPYQLGRFIVCS